jgi:glutathione peroxidase-family protein
VATFNQVDKNDFLYQHYQYQGHVKPENLVFNANLQEFAQRVSYISNLETRGKFSPQEAYQQIEALWQQLTKSYEALGGREEVTKEL